MLNRSIDIVKTAAVVLSTIFLTTCQNSDVTSKGENDLSETITNVQDYTKETISVEEFGDWSTKSEHKLTKSKDISDIRFSLSYLPAEILAHLELRNESYDLSKFQRILRNYSEMTYFNFRIEVIEGNGELLKYQLRSPAEYEARIRYLSFEMEKDVYLIQGKDTIHPGLLHFERIFEVAPFSNIMFAFDNKEFKKDLEFTVVYNDRLFEKGFVKYYYKNNQLINIPTISVL